MATTLGAIDRFRASVLKDGVARPSKYEVRINPPEGIKNVLVICPGFASDCVETLEEINIQGRESFLTHGGENFDLVPCLNDNDDHIELFEKLVTKYI